jgi:5,10-methylenetetrahydromethanopterin reductase
MPGTREQRDMLLHTGHCTFVAPEERKFVTAETIRASTIVGPREAVIDQLRALEAAGLSQVFLNPPMEGFEECLDDISRELIGRV